MSAWIVAAAVVAGALGAVVRYGVAHVVEARLGRDRLPRAVLIVNVSGSLVAGVAIGATHALLPELSYILAGGFAGGLTTFSTWTVETLQLALAGRTAAAFRNVLFNLLAGGVAVWLGATSAAAVASAIWG